MHGRGFEPGTLQSLLGPPALMPSLRVLLPFSPTPACRSLLVGLSLPVAASGAGNLFGSVSQI